MRQEQRDVASLGAVGVIRESLKLFWMHPRPFLLILLTLILPIAILEQVFLYFGYYMTSPLIGSPTEHVSSIHNGSGGFKFESFDFSPYLVWMGIRVVLQIAEGLSGSAVLYAVGLIYTGKTVSFRDIVHAAIPRLWLRLTVTLVYTTLLVYSAVGIVVLVSARLVTQLSDDDSDYSALVYVTLSAVLVLIVGGIFLAMIVILASGVSVLEEDYGCAAFSKGYKLLQGKKGVVLRYYLISLLPMFVSFYLQFPTVDNDSTSIWGWAELLLAMVISSAWTRIYLLFLQLCNSVVYVLCKASHNESIEDSYLFGDWSNRGGYEAIEDSQA